VGSEEFTGQMIGYARTSREDQCLDLQINALLRHGVKKKYIHQEQVSALANKRPQFVLALKRCRPGDVLVVYKLDRLGRSLEQLLETVKDLENRGVQVRSITESIDTTTPMGKLFFHFMAAIAQFERDLISERTADGIAAAKERGTFRSRPVTFTRAQWEDMCEAFRLNNTLGPTAIAKAGGVKYQVAYRYFSEIKAGMEYNIRFPYEEATGRSK